MHLGNFLNKFTEMLFYRKSTDKFCYHHTTSDYCFSSWSFWNHAGV